MDKKFTAKVSINIKADRAEVWKGLTDPSIVKQYFFGTDVHSTWRKGSPITFTGVWEGKPYEDRGTILEIEAPNFMKYNYWSSFSGKPDAPENYAIVTYTLTAKGRMTELSVTQDSSATEEARKESEKNWLMVFDGLKKVLEKEVVNNER